MMAGLRPQGDDADPNGRDRPMWERVDDALAELRLGSRPQYSSRQQEVLARAGHLIVEWAVEVARYEADIDWQWAHRNDDPAMTASALARLIRDTRVVVERAEALLVTALADGPR